MPGWCGKILRIDLSDNRIHTEETERLARLFLGGRGLATKIYWDEVGAEVGAFDAANKIIIMAGPLVGTGVQGATRCTMISKSPMLNPEGFSYGNLGGFFPSELKKAGFDGIVISGKASQPSLIVIRDETVEICDAAALWGKGTRFWGGEEAGNFATYDGKALGAAKIQDRTYVKDSLGLCDFAWPIMDSFNTPDHVGDPELPAQIFSAVTGMEVKEDDLHLFGERIFNLQRSILLREGRKPKESDLPPDFNFSKPVTHVATNPQLIVPGSDENPVFIQGNTLDRNRYESLRREYYQIRKWDPDSGRQEEKHPGDPRFIRCCLGNE